MTRPAVVSDAGGPRITILMPEPPTPANHGGRVDRWTRLKSLQALGGVVQLIYWPLGPVNEEFRPYVADVLAVPRRRRPLSYLFGHPPGRLASFLPAAVGRAQMLEAVRRFAPGCLLADGIDVALPAEWLADELGLPLAYRSQNIEHLYWRRQLAIAPLKQRPVFFLGTQGLFEAERHLRAKAGLVLDICEEDSEWWRRESPGEKVQVLRPLLELGVGPAHTKVRDIDVSFTGGLAAPNNVRAVRWLCRDVMPLVEARLGRRANVVIAGSHPTDEVLEICRGSGATLVADAPSLTPIRDRTRVLVNPILDSSGVNIKTVEMLATGRPIVTTSGGMRGLMDLTDEKVTVADTASGFAEGITHYLRVDSNDPPAHRAEMLQRAFGVDNLRGLLDFAARGAIAGP
jgi:hypothetical protein